MYVYTMAEGLPVLIQYMYVYTRYAAVCTYEKVHASYVHCIYMYQFTMNC